ncbi:uncharacterized protein A4U43_C07F28620 [Asparagus officinalis]|uniref:Uncharacterized protein n=1 Tax=Asparagus officinalis TaxID=4686 RepID=A0A5P1EFP1_ASPOF|nr:uncharacterized protein A4U43_C07F28620 [Asparagus officinalis]
MMWHELIARGYFGKINHINRFCSIRKIDHPDLIWQLESTHAHSKPSVHAIQTAAAGKNIPPVHHRLLSIAPNDPSRPLAKDPPLVQPSLPSFNSPLRSLTYPDLGHLLAKDAPPSSSSPGHQPPCHQILIPNQIRDEPIVILSDSEVCIRLGFQSGPDRKKWISREYWLRTKGGRLGGGGEVVEGEGKEGNIGEDDDVDAEEGIGGRKILIDSGGRERGVGGDGD